MTVRPAAAAATGWPFRQDKNATGTRRVLGAFGVPAQMRCGFLAPTALQVLTGFPSQTGRQLGSTLMSSCLLSSALGLALGCVGLGAGPALAGSCADQGNGQWLCSGAALGGEPGAFLGGVAGHPVVVDLAPGFGLTTSDSTGLGAIALYQRLGVVVNGSGLALLSAEGTALGVTNTTPDSAVDVTLGGTVIGAGISGLGVDLSNSAGGATILDGTANISGTTGGVVLRGGSPGLGATGGILVDLTGSIDAISGTGIEATGHGGDVNLTLTGAVTSDQAGAIAVDQQGTGLLSVTTGAGGVSGGLSGGALDVAAITVGNTAGATGTVSVTTGTGAVIGQGTGIAAVNAGHAGVTVAVGGDVSGLNAYGLDLSNGVFGAGGLELTSVSGSVIAGALGGVLAESAAGLLRLDLDGAVASSGGVGIEAVAGPGSTGLDVAVTDVSGATGGIDTRLEGAGTARITSGGQVAGGSGSGIDLTVLGSGGAGGAEITATGAVTGQPYGIRLTQGGLGSTRVETGAGAIRATDLVNGTGILVDVSAGNAAGVTVVTGSGAVSGGEGLVVSAPDGSVDATIGGAVTGHADDAVRVEGGSGGATLDVAAGVALTGAQDGLDVAVDDGGVTLTGAGNMTGTTGVGLRGVQSGGSGDLALSTGAVTGGMQGVLLENQGTGGISVVSAGLVQGGSGSAVEAATLGDGGLSVDLQGGALSSADAGVVLTDFGTGTLRLVTGVGSLLRGATDGAHLVNHGGTLEVAAAGTIEGITRAGLIAESRSGGGGMDVQVTSVSGATHGVVLTQDGTGEMRLTATGAISGGAGDGVSARVGNTGSGEMILSVDEVTGAQGGIRAIHDGMAGGLDITAAGAVAGQADAGITAINAVMFPGTLGGVSITTQDTVDGATRGIYAVNGGSGDLVLDAHGTITGAGGEGVRVENGATGGRMDLSVAGVSGQGDAIYAENLGSGESRLTVTSGALVQGAGGNGVALSHQGAGNVTLAVHSSATVRGTGGHGMTLVSTGGSVASTRTVTVGLGALVEGSGHGIGASVSGGRLSVIGTGTVRGLSGDGLRAEVSDTGGDVGISLRSAEGAVNGISVLNQGLGAVQVLSGGTLSGATGHGLWVEQGVTTQGGVTVDVAAVSGQAGGILVDHKGQAGVIQVTTQGLVEATGSTAIGLVARNSDGGPGLGGILVETRAVSGGAGGIAVDNIGADVTSVIAHGLIDGGSGDAVVVQTGAVGTDLSVTTQGLTGAGAGLIARNLGTGGSTLSVSGDVAAGTFGVDAAHDGAGALNLSVGGNVTAGAADGIGVRAVATRAVSGGLTATLHSGTAVEGGQHGVVVGAQGGTVRLTASGVIQGVTGTGLAVDLGAGVHGAVLQVGEVSGGSTGIDLSTSAQGPVTLTLAGPVSGGSGAGLVVGGTADQQGAISVEAAGVITGGLVGVQATQAGSGSLTVVAQEMVRASTGAGVVAGLSGAASELEVRLTGVEAATSAVSLSNLGAGETVLTASGLLHGDAGHGAYVEAGANSAGVTVDLAGVQANGDGVVLNSAGGGVVRLDQSGTVTAGTSGVRVNSTGAAQVDVALAQDITGQDGYGVQLAGAGAITLTQTGGTISGTLAGLHVIGEGGPITLSLAGNASASAGTGVSVLNSGAGGVRLTATGLISGQGGHGVVVETTAPGGIPAAALPGLAVDLALAEVTGDQTGIGVIHRGAGDMRLTASGAIQAGSGAGVQVTTGVSSGAVTLDLDGTVSGGSAGVSVLAEGTGPVEVDLSGAVGASAGTGVVIQTGVGAGDLTLTTAVVSASDNGVVAVHGGTGDLIFTPTGDIAVDTGVGLDLMREQAGRIDLTLGAGREVVGGAIGLRTGNVTGGETVLDLSGTVAGDVALAVLGETGSLSRVTLRDGATLRGPVALTSDAGNSVTTVAAGAVIDGAVILGEGDDDLSVAGADLSLVTLLDGGGDAFGVDGWDALLLEDVSPGFLAEALIGWEEITLTGETVLGIGAGAWQAGHVDIGAEAALVLLGGRVDLAGGLTLSGQLGMQNGVVGDALTVGGDFSGGGVVFVDVDFSTATADRLTIGGDVLPGDTPTVLAVEDVSVGDATGAAVVLVDVDGATGDGDFVLAGGPIYKGAFGYDLRLTSAGEWVLAEGFSIMSSSVEATPSVLRGFGLMPTLAMRQDARLRLSPDGRFAGWLRFSGDVQDTSLVTQSGADVTSREAAGLEAGIELRSEVASGAGHWVLGGSIHSGIVRGTVASETGQAAIDAEGWGLGASLSWLGDGGSWVDLQGRVSWQKTDLTSSATGALLTAHDSTVWALGVEAGQRIVLGDHGALVPQVQLSFARVEAGEGEDSLGNDIVLGRNDSMTGRVALSYEFGPVGEDGRHDPDGNGMRRHPFHVMLGVSHDLSGADQVEVAGAELTAAAPRTWGEVGLGGRWTFAKGHEIYAEGSYRQPLGGGAPGDRGLGISLGLRLAW